MNKHRLNLMITMLEEVLAGTWKITSKKLLTDLEGADLILDNVEFHLRTWGGWNDKGETPNHCGFTACAVGHATLDCRFNKLGLKNDGDDFDPEYSGESGWDAVEKFFGIKDITCEWLFMEGRFPPHLSKEGAERQMIVQVIRRIRFLLEKGEDAFLEVFKYIGYDDENNGEKKLLSPDLKPYKVRVRS